MTVMNLNVGELDGAKEFAQKMDIPFRWGYFINPKINGNVAPLRYRLAPEEVIELETKYSSSLFEEEEMRMEKEFSSPSRRFFYCTGGVNSLAISPYGKLNLCLEYHFPQYDLRKGSLSDGWKVLVDYAESAKPGKNYRCRDCELWDFCQWCPADGWLERGDRSACLPYFKRLAELRSEGDLDG